MRYSLNPCKTCGKVRAIVKRNEATKIILPTFYIMCPDGRRTKDYTTIDDAVNAWNMENPIPK